MEPQTALELFNPALGLALVVEQGGGAGVPVVDGEAGAVPFAEVKSGVTEGEDGVEASELVAADLVDAAPVDDVAFDVVKANEEVVKDVGPVGVVDVGFVGADEDAAGVLEAVLNGLVVAVEGGDEFVGLGEGDALGVKEAGLEPKAVALGVEGGAPGGDGAVKPGLPDRGLGGGGGDEDGGVGGELGRGCEDFKGGFAFGVADEEGVGLGLGEVEPSSEGFEGEGDAVGLGGVGEGLGVEAGEELPSGVDVGEGAVLAGVGGVFVALDAFDEVDEGGLLVGVDEELGGLAEAIGGEDGLAGG